MLNESSTTSPQRRKVVKKLDNRLKRLQVHPNCIGLDEIEE
jgi:hypothetical protein